MLNRYPKLLDSEIEGVHESNSPYVAFTERHLQVMWAEQKYFSSLETSSGLEIEVISPGIWNAQAGPDFLKAHLLIGGDEVKGDVELHLNDEGWTQHRHHLDPLYNQVVLHLSLWKPKKPKNIVTTAEKVIPRSYFESNLTIPLARVVQLIDLDLYPYQSYSGTGRCSQSLFKKISKDSIHTFFQDAARWRFEKKGEFLIGLDRDKQEAIKMGMAMAFGYKSNTLPFLHLYRELKKNGDSEEKLMARAMSYCGLFSTTYQEKWGDSSYFQKLFEYQIEPLSRVIPLNFHRVRPLNHPLRRIACLIKVVRDENFAITLDKIKGAWKSDQPYRKMVELIPTYEDPYWSYQYTFIAGSGIKKLPLIGETVKKEVVVNTFLPLLFLELVEDSDEGEILQFLHFYETLSGVSTSKSKYLGERLFGNSPKAELMKKAPVIQGAYQLHHDFCTHYEASCEGCPFVDRYTEHY